MEEKEKMLEEAKKSALFLLKTGKLTIEEIAQSSGLTVDEVKEQVSGDENRNVGNNEFVQVDYRNKVNKNEMHVNNGKRNVGGGQNMMYRAKEKGKSNVDQSNGNDNKDGDVSNKGINEHKGKGKDDANKKSSNVLRSPNKSNS